MQLLIQHLSISFVAILIATVVGLFLGIFISEKQGAAKATLSIVNFLYTLPSLALMGLLIPLTGAGTLTATIALVLYGLLPIVKNTHTGITNIDPVLIEAATGMGSTRMQTMLRVKLPLAAPVIMSGFRNMVVMTISLTTIAAYIGAGGLGTAITRGISVNNMAMVLVASLMTAILAIVIDLILGYVEKLIDHRNHKGDTRRALTLIIVVVAIIAVLFGGYQAVNARNEQNTIRVTSKGMTEQYVLGEMLAELIEGNTDLNAEYDACTSAEITYSGIKNGDYDCYVEYTGTAWNVDFGLDGTYHEDQFDQIDELFQEQDITWLCNVGFNDTYGIAVPQELADQYDLETISDLAPIAKDLNLGAEADFWEREDGYLGLTDTYGYEFGETTDLDQGLKYSAIANGEIDVLLVYTTDGSLADSDLVVLEDDQEFFASYEAGIICRDEVLEAHPELEEAFMKLEDMIDEDTMAQLNYDVDVGGEDAKDVAHEFLVENDLIEE